MTSLKDGGPITFPLSALPPSLFTEGFTVSGKTDRGCVPLTLDASISQQIHHPPKSPLPVIGWLQLVRLQGSRENACSGGQSGSHAEKAYY